ncbi:MAG: tRNA (adenosine(37)-N6)-threonylcarbamoyltransferase complex ATPase subunit type 1 TsaE [Acidobacteria bacterium]|jgi:tRNA threonylcarbamoyladenosine biosynthesis protein TsaE|nr:tRNA (adenosine(37)-N6)-threonylcarbamoyltransferase complex ATPase subunit type 1 TsaE [Acidobacteriota bacterium]
MIINYLSTSPEQTLALGKKIGQCLKGDEVILLTGDLGAGKTLLTKGIAEALDIDPKEVVSPSFTLMNRFAGQYLLFHIDLYRLGETLNGSIPEMDDYMGEGVMIIEWAQYLHNSYFQLKKAINIRFQITADDNREITIETQLTYLRL